MYDNLVAQHGRQGWEGGQCHWLILLASMFDGKVLQIPSHVQWSMGTVLVCVCSRRIRALKPIHIFVLCTCNPYALGAEVILFCVFVTYYRISKVESGIHFIASPWGRILWAQAQVPATMHIYQVPCYINELSATYPHAGKTNSQLAAASKPTFYGYWAPGALHDDCKNDSAG